MTSLAEGSTYISAALVRWCAQSSSRFSMSSTAALRRGSLPLQGRGPADEGSICIMNTRGPGVIGITLVAAPISANHLGWVTGQMGQTVHRCM